MAVSRRSRPALRVLFGFIYGLIIASVHFFGTGGGAGGPYARAVEININSPNELEGAARGVFGNIINRYKQDNGTGFATLGGFMEQKKVSWFGSAIIWAGVYQYSLQTGDTRYDEVAHSALSLASYNREGDILGGSLRAISEKLEGKWNDDIGWWMRTFLKAVEKYGKHKEVSKGVTYYDVAKKTFKEIFEQYDDKCGGGIYWSRNRDTGSKGYAYKSTITNTIAVEAGAVLHTISKGEEPFLQNAKKTEDWLRSSGLVTQNSSIYDGLDVRDCTQLNRNRWSYNAGTFITALVEMNKATDPPDTYKDEIEKTITTSLSTFSSDGLPVEPLCAGQNPLRCNQDVSTYLSVFALSLADGYHATRNPELRTNIVNFIDNGLNHLMRSCTEKWTCSAFVNAPRIPDAMNPYNQFTAGAFILAKHSILNTNGPPRVKDAHADDERKSRSSSHRTVELHTLNGIILTASLAVLPVVFASLAM